MNSQIDLSVLMWWLTVILFLLWIITVCGVFGLWQWTRNRLDSENRNVSHWIELTNNLIDRVNILSGRLDRHIKALEYLSHEVVRDYPVAVKVAREIVDTPLTEPNSKL